MPELNSKKTWQDALSNLITDPKELLTLLELDPALLDEAIIAARAFPLRVPLSFVARMQKGNPDDPLLKQILPLGLEMQEVRGFVSDPLAEQQANPVPGLLHKYHGRVLVTLTSVCAVHCRYFFRRHFPYADNNPGRAGWKQLFSYIAEDPTINEVILSGGDPLAVNDRLLRSFTNELAALSQIKRLRIHTRLPIVLPDRVTDELIEWALQLPFNLVVVVHANHPQEIDETVRAALLRLRSAGIHLLNQAVLLKGVNDNVETLVNLSESLFSAGVLPYYLHVLDKVKGAHHFDLPKAKVRELYLTLISRLPGFLVPRLVREEAGELSKTLLYP